MTFDTVATVVSDAAIELGIASADIADPYAATDPNVIQLTRLLKSVGRRLIRVHNWSILHVVGTISTLNGTATYDVGDGFDRMVDQSAWNVTTRLPLLPVSPQEWEAVSAQAAIGPVNQIVRLIGLGSNGILAFDIYPTPTSAQTIHYEYISNNWVQPVDDSSWSQTDPTAASDTCALDPQLLTAALKLAFLRAKGFDSTAAQQDYDEALEHARGLDGIAPMVSLNRRQLANRFLDGRNTPETGYGA